MRIRIFPKGYSPQIASGPPDKWLESIGCSWSPSDTEIHRQMEEDAKIVECSIPPTNCWWERV